MRLDFAGLLVCGALATAATACSGTPSNYEPIPDPPQSQTVAQLAGPLCQGQYCKCRSLDDDAAPGIPDGKHKRFEFRMGPTDNELWATLEDQILYKSRERAMDCFYIDLLPGRYDVSIRARGDNGFGARLKISELGTKGPWWYDTFEFSCGAPGLCDKETLRNWKAEITRYKEKHDPCGSTKVKDVTWRTGTMPDNWHPSDIQLQLTLQVYDFVPEYGPGDETCARKE